MTVRTVHTSMLLIATASTHSENNQAEELRSENFSEREASNEPEQKDKMMT